MNKRPDFEKIFDWAPGIFLILLPDPPKFTIIAANKARLQATMSSDSQIGKGLFDMFPDDPNDPNATGVENLRHSLLRVLKTAKSDTMAVQKYDIPKPDGSGFEERYWSPVNTPVLDSNGKILYIIHEVEDVTDYILLKQTGDDQLKLTQELEEKVKIAEREVYQRAQEIQKANLKLQTAHDELNVLYTKVKDLDDIKTQLFANVSHELRTPLTLILGPVEELLNGHPLTRSQQDNLRIVQRNARTLLKHVNDLLDVAKLEAGKMTINYSEFNLAKLVRLTASHFESAMASKHIHFTIKTPRTLIVQGDEEKIQRIVMNILSNALKFVPKGGHVDCRLETNDHKVSITITDNGRGIKKELRDVIFERFRQIEGGPTRSTGGTGLGLSIVKDFVDLHHGAVGVSETPGGGATFLIELPQLAPAGVTIHKMKTHLSSLEEINEEEREMSPSPPSESSQDLRPVALIVEDNPDMREFIGRTLADEFHVIKASDGKDGLLKLQTSNPDIILTDIMMPKMSGDQMINKIREDQRYHHIPIILLTAKIDDELKLKLLGDGCQDFLSKPFSQKELLLRVRNLVLMKKSKDILSSELSLKSDDILSLSKELTLRKRELQNSLEAVHVAREQAETASEMKSRLLASTSHELRTPLASILLATEFIIKKNPDIKDFFYFQHILKSSKRLKNLINQLIDYSYFQHGKLTVKEVAFSAQEVIDEIIEEMSPSAENKKIKLISQTDLQESIISDPRLIRIVLSNILSNAIKFTENGVITLKASLRRSNLLFEISDTGVGMSPEDLKRIFEPFEQLEPIQNKTIPGIGLGLSFVKGIIDMMKGSYQVESQLGEGSTFSVTLPIKTIQREQQLSH